MNKKKLILLPTAVFLFFLFFYFLFSKSIGDSNSFTTIKKLIPQDAKNILRKTLYPHREKDIKIQVLEKENAYLFNEIKNLTRIENEWIEESIGNFNKQKFKIVSNKLPYTELIFENSENRFSSGNKNKNNYADKDNLVNEPIYAQVSDQFIIDDFYLPLVKRGNQSEKPLGYIDTYDEKILFLSGNSRYIYLINFDNGLEIEYLQSNLHQIISGFKNFIPSKFGVKDILVKNDILYVSYTNELIDNCYNLNIAFAELGTPKLNFENLNFSNNDLCILESDRFNPHAGGGRIISYEKDSLILSYGSFSNFEKLFDDIGYFGKNIIINLNTLATKVISKGHRNVQGLYYDNNERIILSSEHGPKGGDEVNIIKLNNKILNYGWPYASYGEHYNEESKKLAPLKKTHSEFGYEEPHIYFTPSIGISEIDKCDKEFSNICNQYSYITGSMGNNSFEGDMSIFFFNKTNKDIVQLPINKRIRDMVYYKKYLVVLSENIPAISLISTVE